MPRLRVGSSVQILLLHLLADHLSEKVIMVKSKVVQCLVEYKYLIEWQLVLSLVLNFIAITANKLRLGLCPFV